MLRFACCSLGIVFCGFDARNNNLQRFAIGARELLVDAVAVSLRCKLAQVPAFRIELQAPAIHHFGLNISRNLKQPFCSAIKAEISRARVLRTEVFAFYNPFPNSGFGWETLSSANGTQRFTLRKPLKNLSGEFLREHAESIHQNGLRLLDTRKVVRENPHLGGLFRTG